MVAQSLILNKFRSIFFNKQNLTPLIQRFSIKLEFFCLPAEDLTIVARGLDKLSYDVPVSNSQVSTISLLAGS